MRLVTRDGYAGVPGASASVTPMSMSLPAPRVLGDVIPGGIVRDALLVVGGAAFTALSAQVSIPLPFTPVPLTLQTFAVLLTGAALGTVRGVLSMSLYLVAGVLGAPVFSNHTSGWGGASFGYVIGFVVAAAVVGRLAEGGATRGIARTAGVMVDRQPRHLRGRRAVADGGGERLPAARSGAGCGSLPHRRRDQGRGRCRSVPRNVAAHRSSLIPMR